MKPECCEPDEMTPALSDVEQGGQQKKVSFKQLPGYDTREQKRQQLAEQVQKQKERLEQKKKDDENFNKKMNCFGGSCLVCMILTIIICIICIVDYYLDTFADRDHIDNQLTVVSEKWIDYTTPKPHVQVNCTNTDPCKDWTCSYVSEHFHKTPNECEYDDYLVPIGITNIFLIICCICQCLNN